MRNRSLYALACLALMTAVIDAEDKGPQVLPGSAGAITVPFEMPFKGVATVGLYDDEGALVRTLAQLVSLDAGQHAIRWDGMDYWGRLLPADTQLTVKVIANPGITATYEMSADVHGGSTPWPTRPEGEGDDMRAGGWLGDHSAPTIAVPVGDRVVMGSSLAEFGSNLMITNLDGEKITSRSLNGWAGPRKAATDGEFVYTSVRDGRVALVEPQDLAVTWLTKGLNGVPMALAASPGKVFIYTENRSRSLSPFRSGRVAISDNKSVPEVKGGKAPTEFHQSGAAAYRSVFTGGGRPEVGASLKVVDRFAYRIVVFKEPVTLGSLMLEKCGPRMDIHYLEEGITFDQDEHDLDDLLPEELHMAWTKIGETDFPRRLMTMTLENKAVKTSALMIRVFPTEETLDQLKRQKKHLRDVWSKNKRPHLQFVRIMERRVEAIGPKPKVMLPESRKDFSGKQLLTQPTADAVAWDFHSEYDISHLKPARILLDYGKEQTFRGMAVLGVCNPKIRVQRWVGPDHLDPSVDEHQDEWWEDVGRISGRHTRKLRHFSAITKAHERYLHLKNPTTARYVRLVMEVGRLSGKSGTSMTPVDLKRTAGAEVLLLKTLDHIPDEDEREGSQIFETHQFTLSEPDSRGRRKATVEIKEINAMGKIQCMATDADGTLFTVVDGKLSITDFSGKELAKHTHLGPEIEGARSITVNDEYIAVGADPGIILFDKTGKQIRVIGEGPRQPGPWNPKWIHKASGIGFDKNNRIWLAENSFAPKRVARYDLEGNCDWEAFGPPMYGGGGRLDPNLKHFYYRGVEYALDWAKGESRVVSMMDRYLHPLTPTLEPNSYGWTGVSQVRYREGVRYITGGGVITIKGDEPGAWKPAAVIGDCANSPFLYNKEVWNQHWSEQSLVGKWFIWCDKNDDGNYQIDEVEIFDIAQTGNPLGSLSDDLVFRGGTMLAPYDFTPGGVPLYRSSDITRLAKPEPEIYGRMMRLGGKQSAKPHVGTSRVVTADGWRYREGQPFVHKPDGTLLGAERAMQGPSDYVPANYGKVMNQPLRFVGRATTESADVPEIAMMNGNAGIWYIISPKDSAVIAEIFTGATGGWSTGLPDERGQDVTGRKYRHETFFGDFTKAQDGNYYTVGGKGFHAISRIDGLNDFKITTGTITVPAESLAPNEELRTWMKERPKNDGRVMEPRSLGAKSIEKRTKNFKLDGDLTDWGGVKNMKILGPIRDESHFDMTYNDDGLVIAYAGWSHFGNGAQDIAMAFTSGFGLDFKYNAGRSDPRRIVFTQNKGEWVGIMYRYQNPDVLDEDMFEFASPLGVTRVAEIYTIPAKDCQVKFLHHELGLDLASAETLDGLTLEGLSGGVADLIESEEFKVDHGTKEYFTAEVKISWKALGFKEKPGRIGADVGILFPDSGGTTVDRRVQWSNKKTDHCSDVSIEARLNPRAWGKIGFGR